MFCDSLRSNWVPALLINLDTSVKLTKQIVSILIKFFDIAGNMSLSFCVYIVVSFWSFISVKLISMVCKCFDFPLYKHNCFIESGRISMHLNIDLIELIFLNRQCPLFRLFSKSVAVLLFMWIKVCVWHYINLINNYINIIINKVILN